jgi:mono/diheme cytochrome c family protein
MRPRTMHTLRLLTAGLTAAGALSGLAGCRGERTEKPPRQFFPDMDDQPRWKPQSESEFFADGRTMRPPPEHTVPFGTTSLLTDEEWADSYRVERARFLQADYETFEGTDELGEYVTDIPVPVTMELLERGRGRFNIYCSVCHGYNAEGAQQGANPSGGMVGRLWSRPIPSFHDPKYFEGGERGQAGYIFTVARHGVVTEGVQTMPPYGHALDAQDTWAVVAYIRALQKSWLGEVADVPEAERTNLGAPPPPPAPATPEAPQ